MFKAILALAIASACFCVLQVAPAHAQATRTWVSGVGDDANPCSRTAPCKTYAGAISKTATGGEISVLDSGAYGAVTITKSMSIVAEGSYGSSLASSTYGIIINITNPADPGVVNLNGLFLEGAPPTSPGVTGIRILSAKSVTIQNCTIRSFKGGAVGAGIDINPTTANVEVMVSNTSINNSLRGIRAKSEGTGTAKVMLDRVNITGVTLGVVAGANSTVRISNSTITGVNSAFVHGGNSAIISFGNNVVAGNAVPADDTPTQTIALK